jgi:hypothetical protein
MLHRLFIHVADAGATPMRQDVKSQSGKGVEEHPAAAQSQPKRKKRWKNEEG